MVTLSFTIQGDNEGYVIFECPFCQSEFKLRADEFQSENAPVTDIFCPYCGLTSQYNEFYSQEVVEHIKTLAMNVMIDEINDSFGKMAKKINRSKSSLQMKFKPLKKLNTKELVTNELAEEIFCCHHCERHHKALYCSGKSKVFCPYCGVDL